MRVLLIAVFILVSISAPLPPRIVEKLREFDGHSFELKKHLDFYQRTFNVLEEFAKSNPIDYVKSFHDFADSVRSTLDAEKRCVERVIVRLLKRFQKYPSLRRETESDLKTLEYMMAVIISDSNSYSQLEEEEKRLRDVLGDLLRAFNTYSKNMAFIRSQMEKVNEQKLMFEKQFRKLERQNYHNSLLFEATEKDMDNILRIFGSQNYVGHYPLVLKETNEILKAIDWWKVELNDLKPTFDTFSKETDRRYEIIMKVINRTKYAVEKGLCETCLRQTVLNKN